MARKFLFVCAGLLCLALVFHLGALSVHAQGGPSVQAGEIESISFSGMVAIGTTGDRRLYWLDTSGTPYVSPFPVPGTSPIVATHVSPADGTRFVMLENGDVRREDGGQWSLVGNLFAAATTTQPETWGRLKSRYR